MEINIRVLNQVTREKYGDFLTQTNQLLKEYEENDPAQFQKIKNCLAQKGENWDKTITLIDGENKKDVKISLLIAYEYCLATEKITNGKISFDETCDKLFDKVDRFRIGNARKGQDDECLYGRSVNDKTAVPITSKKYQIFSRAGAQHIGYIKDGKLKSALFIYQKQKVEVGIDENGNPKTILSDGIDFNDLSQEQELLDNIRQTVFHEWNHLCEKEILLNPEEQIDYEMTSNGKKYRNYEKVREYVSYEGLKEEPVYQYESYENERGEKRKDYFYTENGQKRSIHSFQFDLKNRTLENEMCISTGLITNEIMPDGREIIHNQITEGFVELYARKMVKAIDKDAQLDEARYLEIVEMAKRVDNSRDEKYEQGKTASDFLSHCSVLKKELESIHVGEKDGLHYLADYADQVHAGCTPKKKCLRPFGQLADLLKLSNKQIAEIQRNDFWTKTELSEQDFQEMKQRIIGDDREYRHLVEDVLKKYGKEVENEKAFLDNIPYQLGYKTRQIEQTDFGR